jgi:hypothetical protein
MEFVEEFADAMFDFIADGPDVVDVLAGRVVEISVEISLAGHDRAGVATAHRDDDVSGVDDLIGPRLGVIAGDVDADLGHGRDGGRIDGRPRLGAARPGDGPVTGEALEEAQGHLGAAGVVDAQEQHDWSTIRPGRVRVVGGFAHRALLRGTSQREA